MNTLVLLPATVQATHAVQVLGRALFLATSFESDCRMLALCLRLRSDFLNIAKPEEFDKFVCQPAVAKLATNIETIANGVYLHKKYNTLLSVAREARNFIAHEAAENLDEMIKSDVSLSQWRSQLEQNVNDVCLGKAVLGLLLSQVSLVNRPDSASIKRYMQDARIWVFA